jgi:hypothetical protein
MADTSLMEQQHASKRALVEKWSGISRDAIRGFDKARKPKLNFLSKVEDDEDRGNLAILYENTLRWVQGLDETIRTNHVGSFEKQVFPMLRALYANLAVKNCVTISPLQAPTGLVFFFEALYGSNRGAIAKGSKAFDVRTGPSSDYLYSSEQVQQEALGAGTGAVANFVGNLAEVPLRAGTVTITDGTQRVVDNGNGSLLGDVDAGGNNTINYATGAYDVTFAANPDAGVAITADYEQNMEMTTDLPMVDINLTSSPVTARPQMLRTRYSIMAMQDFKSYHGIEAEAEVIGFMSNLVAKELNYRIIRHIRSVASAGNVTFSVANPAGVAEVLHREAFYNRLIAQSNMIYAATQRVRGSWLWCGLNVCNIIQSMSQFTRTGPAPTDGAGPQVIGSLPGFNPVIADPTFPEDEWLMGYKGSKFTDTGYIWAPYLALYTTPTVVLDDMYGRKAMMQRSALKVVNSRMYSTGQLIP